MIGIPNKIVILNAVEFPFQFFDLGVVGVHLLTSAGPVLVDLVDDQGRITEHHEAFYAKFSGDTEAVESCLIFGGIIGGQKMDSKNIAELIPRGGNKQHACTDAINVERAIEVHLPMLRAIG